MNYDNSGGNSFRGLIASFLMSCAFVVIGLVLDHFFKAGAPAEISKAMVRTGTENLVKGTTEWTKGKEHSAAPSETRTVEMGSRLPTNSDAPSLTQPQASERAPKISSEEATRNKRAQITALPPHMERPAQASSSTIEAPSPAELPDEGVTEAPPPRATTAQPPRMKRPAQASLYTTTELPRRWELPAEATRSDAPRPFKIPDDAIRQIAEMNCPADLSGREDLIGKIMMPTAQADLVDSIVDDLLRCGSRMRAVKAAARIFLPSRKDEALLRIVHHATKKGDFNAAHAAVALAATPSGQHKMVSALRQ